MIPKHKKQNKKEENMKKTKHEIPRMDKQKTSWSQRLVKKLRKSQIGAGTVEYVLIALVIIMLIGPAFYFFGEAIANRIYWAGLFVTKGRVYADQWLADHIKDPTPPEDDGSITGGKEGE